MSGKKSSVFIVATVVGIVVLIALLVVVAWQWGVFKKPADANTQTPTVPMTATPSSTSTPSVTVSPTPTTTPVSLVTKNFKYSQWRRQGKLETSYITATYPTTVSVDQERFNL